MTKKKTNKREPKTERPHRSGVDVQRMVRVMTKKWERTAKYEEKLGNEYNSLGPKCGARATRDCIKELRAYVKEHSNK